MRSLWLVVVAVLVTQFGAAWAEEPVEGTIKAAATVTVWGTPDRVRCNLEVWGEGAGVTEARIATRRRMNVLLDALVAARIPGLQVRREVIVSVVGPRQVATEAGNPAAQTAGFVAKAYGSVWVNSEGVPDVLDSATDAVMKVGQDHGAALYSYMATDLAPLWDDAVEKATALAMADARSIAKGLGVTVKRFRYAGLMPERDGYAEEKVAEATPRIAAKSWWGEAGTRATVDCPESEGYPKAMATVYVTAVY